MSTSTEHQLKALKRKVSALEDQLQEALAGHRPLRAENEDIHQNNHRREDDEREAEERSWSQQTGGHSPPYGQLQDVGQESAPPPHDRKSIMLNKSRLYGPSHWTHGGRELRRVAVLMKLINDNAASVDDSAEIDAYKAQMSEIRRLLLRCKLFARNMKASRHGRSMSWPAESSLCMPTNREFADHMAHIYVSRFESAFRILHIPSFWTEYEHYWRGSTEISSAVRLKIELVIAIGSSLYRDSPDSETVRSTSLQLVHAAQSWVSGLMEKDQLGLSGLQVQCLLILARQVLSVSGDLIWIAVGTLVRTAMQMGLHRDPEHFANMTIFHAELRRRLWATILEMNLQASLDSGVPLAMSCNDFDTKSPSNINDDDINDSATTLPHHSRDTRTDTSIQLHLLRYLRVRMELIHRVNGSSPSNFSQDEIQSITSQLTKACQECASQLPESSFDSNLDGGDEDLKVFRYNMADLLLRRFLLTLHRPLASNADISHPAAYFSRKVCLDSATALLSPPPNADFAHLVLLGGGIFKNRIMHATLAVSSELLIDLEEHGRAVQWPSTYRRMLISTLRGALGQLAARISLGETNVRPYMKLSVVLCHAECTETGTALRQRVAQTARESLEVCYAAMQARASNLAVGDKESGDVTEPHQQDVGDSMMSQDLAVLDFSDFGGWDLNEFFGMVDFDSDVLL
ncbi:uncharacterized protein BDZ99DRAFT_434359 [Mytilinidion resinicola]|uniref:Xylanolytic transcriptional activator regulatory domain-containing protein n=1 Tax=Mytilinidion resinicola TaxID=574789 RepID=A0A6A6Z1U1_9PEZI|nr:uncharacterized protein BDZ99DRAFT_434359 [Mytilinidion resinicola]KAF2814633.1 hypothetical protein BDZ99DRAFT_434359 [Mytilinidion resinicola]